MRDFPSEWKKGSPIQAPDLLLNFNEFQRGGEPVGAVKFGCMMTKLVKGGLCGFSKATNNSNGTKWVIDRKEAFEWLKTNKLTLETEMEDIVEATYMNFNT